MKKLVIVTAVTALALSFAASDAAANHRENHQRGGGNDSFPTIFQAPFIDVSTAPDKADSCKDASSSEDGICDGSEGRIASNGAYAVTIQGVAEEPGGHDLCLDILGTSTFVANASPAGSTLIFPGTDGICDTSVLPDPLCTAGLTGKVCVSDEDCVASGNLSADIAGGVITGRTWLDVPFFEVRLAVTPAFCNTVPETDVCVGGSNDGMGCASDADCAFLCTGNAVFRSGIVIN